MADPENVSAEFTELLRKYPDAPTVFAALMQKYMWDDRRPPITRNRLADELHVTRQTVVKWLTGAKPQPEMLPKIAVHTGIPLKLLYEAVGYPVPLEDDEDIVERFMRMTPREQQDVLKRIDAFLGTVRNGDRKSTPDPKALAGAR